MVAEILEVLKEIRDALHVIEKNTEHISNPILTLDGKHVNEIIEDRGFKFPTD